MARLIVIIPLVLLAGFKIFTWYAKHRTTRLETRTAQAQQTIARHEERVRKEITRSIVPTEHGLRSRDDLVVLGTDAALDATATAALDATRSGDWRPVAAYLAEAGTDWDLRWNRLRPFGRDAAEDDAWLQAWRKEQPESADAALLHADALVNLAWRIRTGQLAKHVTREQFEGFARVLGEAAEAALDAVRLAPAEDPNPWVAQIPIAMGLNWDNERFRELWKEIADRDPNHWSAHDRALQYWAAKWHGSHQLAHEFADTAIAAAPAGSLLAALKLAAYWEQFVRSEAPMSAYREPEVQTALDAALADLAAAAPDHHRTPEARGWIAFFLTRSGRPAEAVEQYRALGNAVPWPWANYNDPIAGFTGHRAEAVLAAVDAGVDTRV